MKIFAVNSFNNLNTQKTAAFAGRQILRTKKNHLDKDIIEVVPISSRDKAPEMLIVPCDILQVNRFYPVVDKHDYQNYSEDEDDYIEYLNNHLDD